MDFIEISHALNLQTFDKVLQALDTWTEDQEPLKKLVMAKIEENKGNFQISLEIADSGLKIALLQDNLEAILFGYSIKGLVYTKLGDVEALLGLFDLLNDLNLNDLTTTTITKWALGTLHNVRGVFLVQKGDFSNARKEFKQFGQLKEEIGDYYDVGFSLQNIGYTYKSQGEYKEALSYFNEAFLKFSTLKFSRGMSTVTSNIADIYVMTGNLEDAIGYLNSALSLFETAKITGQPQFVTFAYLSLGRVYRIKGDYPKSKAAYQKAQAIIESIMNPVFMAELLLELMILEIEYDEIDHAKEWMVLFDDVLSRNISELNKLQHQLAKALLLKATSDEIKQLTIAKNIFATIISSNYSDNKTQIISKINLVEILFKELVIVDNQNIFNEIEEHLNSILAISTKQNLLLLSIEIYILQACTYLLQTRVDDMNAVLDEATKVATMFLLEPQIRRISRIGNTLEQLSTSPASHDLVGLVEATNLQGHLVNISKYVFQ